MAPPIVGENGIGIIRRSAFSSTWASVARRAAAAKPMASRFRAQSFFPITDNGITRWTDCKVRPIWGVQWESKREARAHTRIRIPGDGHEKSPYGHEKSLYRPRLFAVVCRPWVRARAWHHSRTPSLLDHRGLATHPRQGARRITANVAKLLGLINDVLDLSKIEAGQLALELSDYCVQDIAQTVRSTLEPLAADKKLAFKLQLAPDLPSGHGDGRRLTQVLINLVGNAIKFTDAGEVAIKAEANNGAFYVSVRDTGPGISVADQAKLFQEFQQADNAITKKKGGTGLGLAISKRIIEMHGGRIWVESQPGQGSTFAFTLPVIVERQVEAA
jgi:hypothetical protein